MGPTDYARLSARIGESVGYQRTQWGVIALPVIVGSVVLLVVVSLLSDDSATVVVWSGVLLAMVSLLVLHFSRLTVTVDDTSVTAAFGYVNWPKRVVPYDEIESVEKVRNAWWYGYGVRWIPGGTMYNVQGNDAVELTYVSGKKFRIGTNDVDGLYTALANRIHPTKN
jgi:hypothetical protein